VDPHENRVHERLFEGPQVEDARRDRPWHPESAGARPLRSLSLDHQALAQQEAPDGGRGDDEDPRGRPAPKGEALREWLPSQLKSNPDLTLAEHCEAFFDQTGVAVSEATMSRNIRHLPGGWPLKKSRP
jgi:hypothetical protein